MGPRTVVELLGAIALLTALGLKAWDVERLQDRIAGQASQITTLQGAVDYQNTQIHGLHQQGRLLEARAAAAAQAALLAGERRRAALPAGHGPAAMNAWLHATFGRSDVPAP